MTRLYLADKRFDPSREGGIRRMFRDDLVHTRGTRLKIRNMLQNLCFDCRVTGETGDDRFCLGRSHAFILLKERTLKFAHFDMSLELPSGLRLGQLGI